MRTFILILLFGLFGTLCRSQDASVFDTRNAFDKKGDYYFGKKQFKKAIVYYNMAYNADADNYYSVLRKAEAFATLDLYDQAAECYRIVFETGLYVPNEYRLKFANLLLRNKDIKGFEYWMSRYNEIVFDETKRENYISSEEVRVRMYRDSSVVIVENEGILNTEESEICPVVYRDRLVFASTRKNLSGSKENDNYDLFSAKYLKSGQLGRLNRFNRNLNSGLDETSVFMDEKKNRLYFTRGASVHSNLETYVSGIPDGVFDALDINEFSVDGFGGIGHVSLNSDGTRMFFVSDAPGGSGGMDIYSSDRVGSGWSKPKNLGPEINSGKDELYPFVLNDTLLYFSSAGHNGLGGLDLYSVNLNRENAAPRNLGSKVNSTYDDYSLSFSPGGLTGYFCSNRPGGFGKEDIYRLQLLDIKIKYAAYRPRLRTSMEEGKINLYLSNGDEYNIAAEDNEGFHFSFQPEEAYKMVIRHENVLANDIVNNENLSATQRKKEMLNPRPIERTDVKLQQGMKYQFTAGMKPIGHDYKNDLSELAKSYRDPGSNTIDLTVLAKELALTDGEIYTIRFEKDDVQDGKAKEETSLFVNGQTIPVSGRSFFIVLPLDIESNFNIKTDIAHFKENFNPKKVGAVKMDAAPVYKKEEVAVQSKGFPVLVNTESFSDADRKIAASELAVIPGTMYILTLSKPGPGSGKDQEVVVPLTKGVKYNLGTKAPSKAEYNRALVQMTSGQAGSDDPNEELIDISVLSKELDILPDEDLVFNLMPAKKFASQATGAKDILTTLAVDGRKYYITGFQKLQVDLNLDQNRQVNIQTDLAYLQENFEPSTIAITTDTTSFNKDIITDPVFDVIVVNFNLNEYSIRPDAKSILENKVTEVMKGDSRLYVTIKGYTDPLGDEEYNERLSRNRALAVKDFLAANGIGENRIRTFSFGESLSLKEGVNWEDLSEAELQKHRKVEIVIYLPK
ncbi:MAG: OmpA family protein [Bacteroidales bacterium]|jgi:outer membrane protein OmpA-like peptidoglycan-associated protein